MLKLEKLDFNGNNWLTDDSALGWPSLTLATPRSNDKYVRTISNIVIPRATAKMSLLQQAVVLGIIRSDRLVRKI